MSLVPPKEAEAGPGGAASNPILRKLKKENHFSLESGERAGQHNEILSKEKRKSQDQ
jgi:hypothetical protein